MDMTTAFLTVCLLAIGGAAVWWLRDKMDEWGTEWEFYPDDDEFDE